jgi:hypothetical protein
MADLTPFATKEDLAAFWRTLTSAEQSRADVLLALASNRLRQIASDLGIDIDAKVADSAIYAANVQWVVMEAVKRAMLVPTDAAPANSIQQTAGPYSENIVFTNPAGDLWFKKAELTAIGLYGRQTLNSISTSRSDIYAS